MLLASGWKQLAKCDRPRVRIPIEPLGDLFVFASFSIQDFERRRGVLLGSRLSTAGLSVMEMIIRFRVWNELSVDTPGMGFRLAMVFLYFCCRSTVSWAILLG